MKALNIHEIRTLAQHLESVLKGGQLQEVLVNDRGLALGFYQKKIQWLVLDLIQPSPMALLFEESVPFQKSKKSKPVGLFLNSNARHLFFESCAVLEQWGRVLQIVLQKGEERCELEVRLIPKQANLIVRAGRKSISWEKPKELNEAHEVPALEERSLRQIREEWLQEQKNPQKSVQDPVAQWEKQRQKDIAKKTKALEEIEKNLAEAKAEEFSRLGEHLKNHGFAGLGREAEVWLDKKKSVSWNIENLFAKAKQIEQKKAGTLHRLQRLRDEIQNLQQAQYRRSPERPGLDDLMSKSEARGRKLHLESGALAYLGRSAADNLSLLRQAKAWDYWLHLKDYPGAHAIIHRQREQNISESEIFQVAAWVAKESLSAKSLMLGQRIAVVIVECRFVKPIKGDKLGRVIYHGERTLQFNYKP